MMLVTPSGLHSIFTAFSAAYAQGAQQAPALWKEVATLAPSLSGEQEYGWIGHLPMLRHWSGDRIIQSLQMSGYTIKNKRWEATVSVPLDAVQDDSYGVFGSHFSEMGYAAEQHKDELVFGLLSQGFAQRCHDGQYFFDTDHPLIQPDASVVSASNHGGGSGTPWYLLDTSRALRPIIYQERQPAKLTRLDKDTDENVFHRAELIYGVDSRANVGFGLWQFAYGSKQTLDETNLGAAIAAMRAQKGDGGRVIGVNPTALVVPPSLELAARKLLVSTTNAAGAGNPLQGMAKLIVSPWL